MSAREDRKEGGNTYHDEIADLIRDLRAHALALEAAQPQNDPDEDVESGDEPAQEAAGQDPHNNGQSFGRFAKPHDLAIEYLRELDIRSGGSYLDEIACLFEEL